MFISLKRRTFLQGIAAALAAPSAWAASSKDYEDPAFLKRFAETFDPLIGVMPNAPLRPLQLKSITIRVADLQDSVAFYQRTFGMRVQAHQGKNITCMRFGGRNQFLRLVQEPGGRQLSTPCLSIEHFDPDRVVKILTDLKVPVELKYRGPELGGGGPGAPKGTPEVFFRDPEGLQFQIAHDDYAGGAGLHGDVISLEPEIDTPNKLMRAQSVNHVSFDTVDVIGNSLYYQKIFRMPILTTQGKWTNPVFGVGPNLDLALGSQPLRGDETTATVNHFAIGVKDFSPEVFIKEIAATGLKVVETADRTPRSVSNRIPSSANGPDYIQGGKVMDPDGYYLEVVDTTYCAGDGPRGNICKGRKNNPQ